MADWRKIGALVGNGADDETVYARDSKNGFAVVWNNINGFTGVVLEPGIIPMEDLDEDAAILEQSSCGDDYEVIITVKLSNGSTETVSIDSFGDCYFNGEPNDYVGYFVEEDGPTDEDSPEFEGAFELFYSN